MITENNFVDALIKMGFCARGGVYEKSFGAFALRADITNRQLIFPAQIGAATYDSSRRENLVVFECVNRLLEKGYNPADIEIEKTWTLGHEQKSGRADIVVSKDGRALFIIECKTFGGEFEKELRNMKSDGGQLFSYWQQENSCKWLILYAADFNGTGFEHQIKTVNCSDYKNLIDLEDKQPDTKLFKNAHTVEEKFAAWDETYEKNFEGDLIFSADSGAYDIGVKPKRKCHLEDFSNLKSVVNEFEEILRHNNVSDKENAFNRLIALFICKLVDEANKGDNDLVEFFYNAATDSYETLQDRLQRLHRDGMKNFMNETVFYLEDDYAEKLIAQYTGGNRAEFIDDLRKNLRRLKFFTNNDFAFKEVHNEELFYQNGKVVVEVVKLFQNYKIIGAKDLQTLGDLFEQLLSKGFKQNEGQFFTPIPIARFIWDSLPLDDLITDSPPKIIDYACGAGHFLTEGFAAVNACFARKNIQLPAGWELDKLFGVEKDYRLARVSKISLFMNGVNKGKIKFGDGLENYPAENISAGTFDILVANPPYAIKNFKQFIRLKNEFATLDKISNEGSEIETLFVERIEQLLKTGGIAAVILPSSILNKDGKSFIAARESLLQNFHIRALAQFGSKTFSATGTNTVILFLQRLSRSPSRFKLLKDSVNNILRGTIPDDWEDKIIFAEYLKKINVDADTYKKFISRDADYTAWRSDFYFGAYVAAFEAKFALRENFKFYEYALAVEFEKIHYFAMTYTQKTLVITAPADNSEQEKFLGYSWSNAKGDEGIKFKTRGGLLYDDKNRTADNRLAAAVRNAFANKKVDIPEVNQYFTCLKLSDMLTYTGADFTKSITLSKVSAEELTGRLFKTDRIERIIDINLKTFDPKTTPDKKYHYVDISAVDNENNMINFSNEILGENAPSRARRIANDNDVLISTVRPNLKSFAMVKNAPPDTIYSTGFAVLTSKNPAVIANEFIFLLFMHDPLLMAQMTAKMTKGSYPSINQNDIKNFYIPVPPIEMQRQIVSEFRAIDTEILAQKSALEEADANTKNKFIALFGSYRFDKKYSLLNLCTDDTKNGTKIPASEYLKTGDVPIIDQSVNEIAGYANLSVEPYDNLPCVIFGDHTEIFKYSSEKFYLGADGVKILIPNDRQNLDTVFLFYMLQLEYKPIGGYARHFSNLKSMNFYLPPIELQKEFAAFAQEQDAAKEAARRRIEELQNERSALVEKYFR